MKIDFAAVRERHSLAATAKRTGYSFAEETGDVFVSCPMPGHDDSTPSMLLHLDQGRYHCFGCGASGDVVQWVRDVYSLATREAVERLDSRERRFPDPPKGPVTALSGEARQLRRSEQPDLERTSQARVLETLREAWRYYTLPRLADRAADYLIERGINSIGLTNTPGFGNIVGHTPRHSDQLVSHLRDRGFGDDELVDAGLARRRDGQPLTDAFQHRVLLPVRDVDGKTIGIIGRSTLGEDRRIAAKYLNPPRTAVYDKSTALYTPGRFHRMPPDGQVVIVEGSIDALAVAVAAHAAGLTSRFQPVSTSGLGFSDSQIDRILALHPRAPVIALDGDQAGWDAAAQLAARFAMRGREAAIVSWPAGHDPASWLSERGPDGLAALTRRGCLEADGSELRPHHAAREATTLLMRAAGPRLDAKVAAALAPTQRMTPPAADRYAQQAAEVVAPVIVSAAADVSTDNRGRVNNVIETVASYGNRLPTAAQLRYVELAVESIEELDLAPGAWAERQISARLDQYAAEPPGPAVSAQAVVLATSVTA
jgi:DNA primase